MQNELIKLSKTLSGLGHKKHSSIVRGLGVPSVSIMLSKFAGAPNPGLIKLINGNAANSKSQVGINLSYKGNDDLGEWATGSDEISIATQEVLTDFIDMVKGINADTPEKAYETRAKIKAITVSVYTDTAGNDANNEARSQRRADIIVAALRQDVPGVTFTGKGMGEDAEKNKRYLNFQITEIEARQAVMDSHVVALNDGGTAYWFLRQGNYFVVDVTKPDAHRAATKAESAIQKDSTGKGTGDAGNALVYFGAEAAIAAGAISPVENPAGTIYMVDSAKLTGAAAMMSLEDTIQSPTTPSERATKLGASAEAGQVARTESEAWPAEVVKDSIRRLLEIREPLEIDPDGGGSQPAAQALAAHRVRRNMRRMFKTNMEKNPDGFDRTVQKLAQEMTASPNFVYNPDEGAAGSNIGMVFMAAMQSESVAQSTGGSASSRAKNSRKGRRRMEKAKARARKRSDRERYDNPLIPNFMERGQKFNERGERKASSSTIESLHKISMKKSSAKSAAKKRRERIKKENMR